MKQLKREQFAAMNMIYSRYSFGYFLDSMDRLGIHAFELWTGGTHPNNFVPSLRAAAPLKKLLRERGQTVVCLTPEQCLYPHNIAVKDPELRRFSVDYFLDYIDMASELEVDKMLCCAGWGDLDDDPEASWQRSIDSLGIMLDRARERGVTLAFEILCPFESNLVFDIAGVRRMMDVFRDERFGLCVDTVPMRLSGSTLEDFFREFGPRICHVHMTDGTPTGHIPTGTGEHPIGQYIETLGAFDYSGRITLELGSPAWQEKPEEATRISFDTIRQYINA